MSQGIFPWSRRVPYAWSRWFAWYPVRLTTGQLVLGWVECRAHGEVAPNGELDDRYEFRR